MNRNLLRGLNYAERKKAVDNYFIVKADKFVDFKEKIGTSCNSQISGFLSNYFHLQSGNVDFCLCERLSNESLLEERLREITNFLRF